MSNPNPHNQFPKGHCGNPNGRPKKGESWKDILKETFGEEVEFKGSKIDYKRLVCQTIRKHCLKGNDKMIKLAMERMEGKPKEQLEHTGPNGGPIDNKLTIEFVGVPPSEGEE